MPKVQSQQTFILLFAFQDEPKARKRLSEFEITNEIRLFGSQKILLTMRGSEVQWRKLGNPKWLLSKTKALSPNLCAMKK